jgi:hypothetical protein
MGFSATVPRFGFVVEPNLARCFLHRAYDALQAGKLFEAGCLLREGVRRQLVAECKWYDCLPKDFSDRTPPLVLLKVLRRAGHYSVFGFDMTKDIIYTANRAAHCCHVKAGYIRDGIAIMHGSIDNDPCGEPRERIEHCIPADDCDCGNYDDDDGADWWKSEGGAA